MGRIKSALVILIAFTSLAFAVDLTLEPKSKGPEVVEATLDKIRSKLLFSDDSDFLHRLAFVETHFGNDPDTFISTLFKGIWRLSEDSYNKTKSTSLNPKHANISSAFNIDWKNTNWDQLNTPLYGALAAYLFIETLPGPIPQTKDKQAKFWFDHYTQLDKTEVYFKDEIAKLEEDTPPCEGKMDLVVILDGSGSVTAPEFTKAKNFVANFLDTFSYDSNFVRKGFIVFSAIPETIFPLTNNLNATEMKRQVLNARYPAQGTITNEAIKSAVNLFQIAPNRIGVPRVMTLFTDGMSQGGVSNIEMARRESITPFAIGIGDPNNLNPTELLEIALEDPSRVYILDNFDALLEFSRRLNSATCKLPQRPSIGENMVDTLGKNQKRFYQLPLPAEGLGVNFITRKGSVVGYYSRTYPSPNSAIHDGILLGNTFIPALKLANWGKMRPLDEPVVYLSFEGTNDLNEYEFLTGPGSPDFSRFVQLSPEINVTWDVFNEKKKVQFQVHALTQGFISFGISEDGVVTDFILGGLNDDETPYFTDRYSSGRNSSKIDDEQNWRLIEVQENVNSTILWFIRSFDTGDNAEDLIITDREIQFVWAIGYTDDPNTRPRDNGSFPVNILEPELENFERTEQISPLISVTWKVNFDTMKVTFDVSAITTAYVGFGISKEGGMYNADLITGGVDEDLLPYFQDRYSAGIGEPIIDQEQNWLLLLAREERGTTHLKFIRDFDTGDLMDLPILNEATYFIWAIGDTDEVNYHATRGNFPVNILQAIK